MGMQHNFLAFKWYSILNDKCNISYIYDVESGDVQVFWWPQFY
jgi:hypothetical protein